MAETRLTLEPLQPTETDARLIWEWRNDPQTRMVSFNQEPVPWESFWNSFFEKSFAHPQLAPVFACLNGEKIAFIAFRPIQNQPGRCDISINLAPSARGKGMGAEALKIALAYLEKQGIHEVLAEIKPDNAASVKAFEKAGFRESGSNRKQLPDGQTMDVLQYLAQTGVLQHDCC